MSKGLEYVKNQIAKLKDDLQHYTMVEKDSVLASQIKFDLEHLETIEKELKVLNIIRKYGHFDFYTGELIVNVPVDNEEEYDLLKEVLL